jgi:hypothetical protein
MKTISLLLASLACLFSHTVSAADQPRGNLLELHSCELYAGGCIVSSEATLGGRYMLRVWNFTSGSASGTDLAGLRLAVLQASSQNIAAPDTDSDRAVVYLPNTATATQREALLGWLKSAEPALKLNRLLTRVVPMQFTKTDSGYSFSAGDCLSIKTAPRESCETGACGEALWYIPRTPTSVFTVAVDRASKVNEPLLQLKWNDGGKRSVFLARFGESAPAKNVFVSSAELCGPAAKTF